MSDLIEEALVYDPDTGELSWLVTRGRAKAGSVAGNVNQDGYLRIKVGGRWLLCHRVAWFLYYGVWPIALDHINNNRTDNRLANLREATPTQNARNMGRRERTLPKGVTYIKARSVYQAQLGLAGKTLFLGYHATPEAAHAAYKEAALYHFKEFANNGDNQEFEI